MAADPLLDAMLEPPEIEALTTVWRRLAARSATGAPERRACAKRFAVSSGRCGQVTPRPAPSQAY
jgi:hypothetical protein